MLGVRCDEVDVYGDLPQGAAPNPHLTGTQRTYLAVRRPIEVLLSLVLLIVSLPILAVLAIAVALDSPGSPVFRQERIGRGGRPFTIYKLRTMVRETPPYLAKVAASDSRITRTGHFLRLSGLDELPQLFNVLRGDLNLVGPRPEMAFMVERFDAWERRRDMVRPGITGWWQIHHRTGDPLRDGIAFDMYYLQHLGPRLDAAILVGTVWVMLKGAWDSARYGGRRLRVVQQPSEES